MENIKLQGKIIASLQAALHFIEQESNRDEVLFEILTNHVEKRQKKFFEDLENHREDLEKVDNHVDRIRQKLENS